MTVQTMLRKHRVAAGFGALMAAGLGLFLLEFNLGRGLVNHSYDLLLVARGDLATKEAVIIYLDEASFEALQQRVNAPWDRALHARLIDRLTRAGARAIALDIVFTDPMPG